MDYTTDTGSLIFTMDADDIRLWSAERAERGYVDIADIFHDSGLAGNCDLETLRPEEVGALTDSPIFAENCERDDDGTLITVGNVWWFPDYQVIDPTEVLLETGCVSFTPAPENKQAA